MKYYLIAILFLVGFVSLIPYSFATIGAGDEYEPTQQNAFASYNNSTNHIQVTWDFDTLPSDTTCFLKGDASFNADPNTDADLSIAGFIPRYYSTVSSSYAGLQSVTFSAEGQEAEAIPCTGDMRLNVGTILNHATNKNSLSGFEMFLTFYIENSDGDFDSADAQRIDEVFLIYSSTDIISSATQDWACDEQIGNVLFMGPSGSDGTIIAHGNNGDNCDQYLYVENDQYVDIGMVDSGSEGVAVYGTHDDLFSLLLAVFYSTSSSSSSVSSSGNGGSDCNDCIPPTLGINKRGQNMVSDGFSFNGNYVNVEYRYTPFPLITTQVGSNNTMTFKIFENEGIGDITNAKVGLGLPNSFSRMTQAEVFLDIKFLNGNVTDIEIKDDQFLIQNVTSFSETTTCKESSNQENCLEVTLIYFYREAPLYNIVTIAPVDDHGLWWPVYFNHGIKVIGDSLNFPDVKKISGVEYIQVDKFNKIWKDKQEIKYKMTAGGWMDRITPSDAYVCNDIPLDEINGGYGRSNCHFRALTPLWLDE